MSGDWVWSSRMSKSPATGRRMRRAAEPGGNIEQAVCDALERLLATRKLADLSVAEILREAGTSRGSFYFYFASKNAVLAALAERVNDEVFEATQTWLHRDEGQPPEPALRAAMQGALALWRAHAPVIRAMVESWRSDPELDAAWRRLIGRFTSSAAEQIDRERAAGIAPPGPDSGALGAMLTWTTERCLYLAVSDGEPAFADDEALVATLTHVWWRAIYAR